MMELLEVALVSQVEALEVEAGGLARAERRIGGSRRLRVVRSDDAKAAELHRLVRGEVDDHARLAVPVARDGHVLADVRLAHAAQDGVEPALSRGEGDVNVLGGLRAHGRRRVDRVGGHAPVKALFVERAERHHDQASSPRPYGGP